MVACDPYRTQKKQSGRSAMACRKAVHLALCGAALLWAVHAAAQQPPASGAEHPGRAAVMGNCFQCHTDAMFRDARQDSRAWEASIYRMVGRGGLWTTEEIKRMSDYLGTDFGPNARPSSANSR
jgi:mono/diheme cytochrome c family protein